jgi:hypothetical protein
MELATSPAEKCYFYVRWTAVNPLKRREHRFISASFTGRSVVKIGWPLPAPLPAPISSREQGM